MNYQDFCEKLAREAGAIARESFGKVKKEEKGDKGLVTKTDIKINSLVIKRVKEVYPEHDVLGEEESDFTNKSDFVWVCDPIDGTISFANSIPTFMFSLALVHKGEPILGVTYDAFMDLLYYAEKEKGATCNGVPIHVNDDANFTRKLVGYSMWKSDGADLRPAYNQLLEEYAYVVDYDSVVYMCMKVATGHFVGSLFAGTGKHAHDIAAVKIIVEEAGGKVTDVAGKDQRYDQDIRGAIISNGITHDKLVKLVNLQDL